MEERNKYTVEYSDNALDNLDRIFKYIAFFYDENYVDRFLLELEKYVALLEIFPELYPKCSLTFHGETLRKLPFNGYIALYLLDHTNCKVIIINVFSELENIQKKF